jgi:hypothetical protein
LPRGNPLIASLAASLAAIDRGNPTAAINQLQAFQNKVLAQLAPMDPVLAAQFIREAQKVIDALSGASPVNQLVKIHHATRQPDGNFRMQLSASEGRYYIVEASTNLIDWEVVGVARPVAENEFDFEDVNSPRFGERFYRIVSH